MHWALAFGGLAGLLALVILIWNRRPRRQLRLRRAEVIELEARSRLALASAQESRQRFEDLVEQSPAVVEFYDTTETGEVYLSPTWFGMLVFRDARALMTNAVKHAKARKVTLSMDRRAGALRIRVRDDGNGFDPRELAQPANCYRSAQSSRVTVERRKRSWPAVWIRDSTGLASPFSLSLLTGSAVATSADFRMRAKGAKSFGSDR